MSQVIETGGPKLEHVDVVVSTAELLTLFDTAKSLVAAQGAGTVVEFVSALLAYDYNSIVYTTTSATNLQVQYTNISGAAASNTRAVANFIDQASDQLSLLENVGGATAITPVVNAALVLTCAGANPAAGNSPINISVYYRVHQTSL